MLCRIRIHTGRKGERRSLSEAGYQALVTAAHHQLHAPIILCWDNLNTQATRGQEGSDSTIRRDPLKRDSHAVITGPAPVPVSHPRKELITRLRRRRCELCEQGATVAVHQVTRLADLGKPGPRQPAWASLMATKRRKTLIVCATCHEHIHANPVTPAA